MSAEHTVEDTFWAEMNRREKWDRDYEQRLRSTNIRRFPPIDEDEDPLAVLEQEKKEEEKLRLEWDQKCVSLRQARLSGKSHQGI